MAGKFLCENHGLLLKILLPWFRFVLVNLGGGEEAMYGYEPREVVNKDDARLGRAHLIMNRLAIPVPCKNISEPTLKLNLLC